MEAIARDPSVMGTPVEKVMGPKLPTIGVGQKVERAVKMLEAAPALLVLSGGRPLAVDHPHRHPQLLRGRRRRRRRAIADG